MKRLLGLVAIVALVACVMPGTGVAGLRGAFDPIGRGDLAAADGVPFGNGLANGEQTPAPRQTPFGSGNGIARLERWVTFTTRDQVFGFEGSREIWQLFNRTSSPLLVATIAEARSKIFGDPTGHISYIDPAWSPNGKYLAYVLTDNFVTSTALVIQEFAASTTMLTSITPVNPAIVIVPDTGSRSRHPNWSPDGRSLAFDSDASGTSIDVYTVQVFDGAGALAIGSPVRHTFVNNRAEQNPAWAPDGVRIAYDTNLFGPNIIQIVDTSTNAVSNAENNFASVSHSHPDWSSDGASVYYDAPENEDPQQNQDIWKLDLASQAKCPIHLDGAGDVNVRVSRLLNTTNDGIPYNNIYFESQAFAFSPGICIWRANPIQSCVPPLPMAIAFNPASFSFSGGQDNPGQNGQVLTATFSFPPETQAAGYQCVDINGPREGVRMRTSLVPSPTLMGLRASDDNFDGLPDGSGPGHDYKANYSQETLACDWSTRTITNRLVSLGLVNTQVPVEGRAYSNIVGRTFKGFGLLKISTSSLAGSVVSLEQNSPNPFNPMTKIRFAVSKDSQVALRVYNVRGQLVKTLANERMAMGSHEVSWDGRDANGSHVASGVYYAKVSSDGGTSDVIKMVMAK